MKRKSIVLTLAISLAIGISATAYAATSNSTSGNNSGNRACSSTGMGRITNFRGHDILTNFLKSKGLTDTEINSALNSGKSIYDLIKDKGITDEEIKSYMLNERIESIDKAVTDGSITSAQGEEIKSNIQENSANCITPGQGNGRMRGQGNMYHQRTTN